MNKRCTEILIKIINSPIPLKIKELSQTFNVSNRTIRYDLDHIDDYLKNNHLSILMRKPHKGISFKGTKIEQDHLLLLLKNNNINQYIYSQEERRLHIFYIFLSTDKYTTIEYLSSILDVSKNTIQNDIKVLKKYLNNGVNYLQSDKGKGFKLIGEEKILRDTVSSNILKQYSQNNPSLDFLKIFKDISIHQIQEVIKCAEKQMKTTFPDDKFNNLAIHLIIAIKRIKMGKDIIMDKNELSNLYNTPEFSIAASIATNLEKIFNIDIPQSEIGYITIHLLGTTFFDETIEKNIYLQNLVIKLIKKVSNTYNKNFNDDDELYKNLLQHIQAFIYRLEHNISINNPLLNEIKTKYSSLFNAIKKAIHPFSTLWNITINDSECAYICIHFLTSIEKNKNKNKRKARVLLVCSTGIGTSKYLLNRLESIFDFDLIGTSSYHNAYDYIINNQIDLIITTIPLKNIQTKWIQVQLFLTEKNFYELSQFFSKYNLEKPTLSKKTSSINNIIDLISKNYNITDNPAFRKDLLYIIKKYTKKHLSLIDFLSEDHILMDVDVTDWKEAINICGNLLVNDNSIKSGYIEDIIKTINIFGDYMILAPLVVMPHAKANKNVLLTSMSLIRTKEPILFGKTKKHVQLFIILAAKDHTCHIMALKELMFILDSTIGINLLLKSKDKYDLIHNINQFLANIKI